MNRQLISATIILCTLLLNGCMSREEAAKHVTITLIQSPETNFGDWHTVSANNANGLRFESPLGRIDISQAPTHLTTTTDPQIVSAFNVLKQETERQIIASHSSLINPADDDSLQLANHDFLHTTYRTRDSNNQRQHIELYLAPINGTLVTIIVQIGDDVDVQSYNQLQTLLTQQVDKFNKQ
jgi:hypothetical protein